MENVLDEKVLLVYLIIGRQLAAYVTHFYLCIIISLID
jgi:hypothetical protein